MHIHILGVCGTFMAGVARLARAQGHDVTGSDAQAYPPMSDQLAAEGIPVMQGYDPTHLQPAPNCVVVGNALARGNPMVEYMLNRRLPFVSGPAWLADHVLKDRWVIAVAGTHGKTTTASMVAWILDCAGLEPGFLIGGVPVGFGVSSRLGTGDLFVVEADEYDTAFFDKRSKFVHYRPTTLVLNNLEYDHADIFPDLGAIQRQFHHLVRTVAGDARIIRLVPDGPIDEVLAMGCWTPVESFGGTGARWLGTPLAPDASRFAVTCDGADAGIVEWELLGNHNLHNGLAAIAAAAHAGVDAGEACEALGRFSGVKRRLEKRGEVAGISVYDDFAHHPSAIATTLDGLRRLVGERRIIAVLEPRSNTMRLGVHRDTLAASLTEADLAWVFEPPDLDWDLDSVVGALDGRGRLAADIDAIVTGVAEAVHPGDQVVIMSNGGFGGIHERLVGALMARYG